MQRRVAQPARALQPVAEHTHLGSPKFCRAAPPRREAGIQVPPHNSPAPPSRPSSRDTCAAVGRARGGLSRCGVFDAQRRAEVGVIDARRHPHRIGELVEHAPHTGTERGACTRAAHASARAPTRAAVRAANAVAVSAADGETQADTAVLFSDDADTAQPGGLVMDVTWSTRRPARTIFAERLRNLHLAPCATNLMSADGMEVTTGTHFVGRLTTVSNPYFGTNWPVTRARDAHAHADTQLLAVEDLCGHGSVRRCFLKLLRSVCQGPYCPGGSGGGTRVFVARSALGRRREPVTRARVARPAPRGADLPYPDPRLLQKYTSSYMCCPRGIYGTPVF